MGTWGDGNIPAPGTFGRRWRQAVDEASPFARLLRAELAAAADGIDVDEAAGLEKITARLADTMPCPVCEGSGRVPGMVGLRCRSCAGTGEIERAGPEQATP